MVIRTMTKHVMILALLAQLALAGPPVAEVKPPDVIAVLVEAHGLLHGAQGIDPDQAPAAKGKLDALSKRLTADPTTFNKDVRRRVDAIAGAIGGGKLPEADELVHQLFRSLSRPPKLSHEGVRAILVDLHPFMHVSRKDAARRCQSALRDQLDLLEMHQTDFALWAQKWFRTLIGHLESGQTAVADEKFHHLIKALEPKPPVPPVVDPPPPGA